jgi:DNA repair photolyase
VAPVIPFVTEPDLERVLETVREAGAVYANYIVLQLPWEVRPLFEEWLQAHFPDRAERVPCMRNARRQRLRCRLCDAHAGNRGLGGSDAPAAADRLGFRYNRFELLDTSRFRAPPRESRATDDTQGSLF